MSTEESTVRDHQGSTAPELFGPGTLAQLGSMLLPVLRCALCPACLGAFGGLLAGTRLGLLQDERFHGAFVMAALVVDLVILRAAFVHHKKGGPLFVCAFGALFAIVGHFFAEELEFLGLLVLVGAALWNVLLLRRHRREGHGCCPHESRPAFTTGPGAVRSR
jgi:hypothetical protein